MKKRPFEVGDFVQHMRRDPKMNAWRCAGVVTKVGPVATVVWLDFDRQAYSLVWPSSPMMTHGVGREKLYHLEPEKCIMPIDDGVMVRVMKLRMGFAA